MLKDAHHQLLQYYMVTLLRVLLAMLLLQDIQIAVNNTLLFFPTISIQLRETVLRNADNLHYSAFQLDFQKVLYLGTEPLLLSIHLEKKCSTMSP